MVSGDKPHKKGHPKPCVLWNQGFVSLLLGQFMLLEFYQEDLLPSQCQDNQPYQSENSSENFWNLNPWWLELYSGWYGLNYVRSWYIRIRFCFGHGSGFKLPLTNQWLRLLQNLINHAQNPSKDFEININNQAKVQCTLLETNIARENWWLEIRKLLSFWKGLFSGAMFVFWGVCHFRC